MSTLACSAAAAAPTSATSPRSPQRTELADWIAPNCPIGVDRAVGAHLGCGPGRVAAFLAAKGVEVVGIDLSLGMLEMARRAHPDLRCAVGDLGALPLANRSLDG